MSVVNKLEISYLNLLRVVVLVVASILLLVALVTGISGLMGVTDIGNSAAKAEQVSPDDVIKDMGPAKEDKPAAKAKEEPPKAEPADPYKAEYERIATAIDQFVTAHAGGAESINKEKVVELLAADTNKYESEDTRHAYITGLAATVEKALKHETVIARVKKDAKPNAKPVKPVEQAAPVEGEENSAEMLPPMQEEAPFKESPIAVAIEVITKYTEQFHAKLAEAEAENTKRAMEKAANAAASMMKLYVAGGAFLSFLLVVFMSILVKIERNLRVISEKP